MVPLRPLVPGEGGVLLSADGHLKLVGRGGHLMVEGRVNGADVEEPGSLVLPARLTAELVAKMGDERLELLQEETPLGMAFESSRTRARVRGWGADEFPMPETKLGMSSVAVMDGETLRRGIAATAYAASTDAAHDLLKGVSMTFRKGEVTLAAADGFRLAVATIAGNEEASAKHKIVVPASALRAVGRLLPQGEVEVSIDENGRRARFSSAEVVVTSGLLAGSYPDYSALVQREWDVTAVVNRDHLESASKTARALSGSMAKLEFSPEGTLTVSVKGKSKAGEADGRMELACESHGEAGEVLISTLYLTRAVSAIPSERVRLHCNSEDRTVPLLIESVADEAGLGAFRAVIMPMLAS